MIDFVSIKDMSAGSDIVGEMWKETRVFSEKATLFDVMKWAGSTCKNVVITVPENFASEFNERINEHFQMEEK